MGLAIKVYGRLLAWPVVQPRHASCTSLIRSNPIRPHAQFYPLFWKSQVDFPYRGSYVVPSTHHKTDPRHIRNKWNHRHDRHGRLDRRSRNNTQVPLWLTLFRVGLTLFGSVTQPFVTRRSASSVARVSTKASSPISGRMAALKTLLRAVMM